MGVCFLEFLQKENCGEWRLCEFWQTHEPRGIHFSRNPCQKDVAHTASIFPVAPLRETFNKLFTWEGNKKENNACRNGTNESHGSNTAPVDMLGRTGNSRGRWVRVRDRRVKTANIPTSPSSLWVQRKHSSLKEVQETKHLKER